MLLKQIRLHRDVIANNYNKRNTFLRKKKKHLANITGKWVLVEFLPKRNIFVKLLNFVTMLKLKKYQKFILI